MCRVLEAKYIYASCKKSPKHVVKGQSIDWCGASLVKGSQCDNVDQIGLLGSIRRPGDCPDCK